MFFPLLFAAGVGCAPIFQKTLTLTNAGLDEEIARLTAAAPGLVRVSDLGLSGEGRPIRMLTVTEAASGDEMRKPACYVQGNIHSKELSGTTVALYLAQRLAGEHRPGGILSRMVFYIVPRCNPDGAERMVACPGNERSGWGALQEGDGLFREKDVDGDGEIAMMRVEDPEGPLVRSPKDPRCLVSRRLHPDAPGPFYRVYDEGVFLNWKGKPSTLPHPENLWRKWLDYNRDWEPWNGKMRGAGDRAFSVPETRLQAEFMRNHPNIRSAISLHNGWGMVMLTYVAGRADRDLHRAVASRCAGFVGFPMILREEHMDNAAVFACRDDAPRGDFDGFCYRRLGIPCVTIELGTRETSAGLSVHDMKGKANVYTAPYEVIAMEDARPGLRKSFLPWRKCRHPQLGDVEIGGLSATVFGNPTAEDLAETAEGVFRFLQADSADILTNAVREAAFAAKRNPFYDAVYAPVTVAVPPSYAVRDLCRTADGEIRHYGKQMVGGEVRRVYIASRDNGLTWRTELADESEAGAMIRSPESGEWIGFESDPVTHRTVLLRSATGPGDPSPSRTCLPWVRQELRQLFRMKSRGRWIAAFSDVRCEKGECYHSAVAYSDDDGRTWKRVQIRPVPGVSRFAPGDKRPHWFNNGCEPSVVERLDGSLLMAVRTSGPHAAFYVSRDGGENWSDGAPDRAFWQANTMPYLFRLSDGRLLFIWNNTAMLPTRDVSEYPELTGGERGGAWEAVFTNRDALHAAISDDDGRTWRGFREIALNDIRNACDYRELGNDPAQEHDKSVHQTQALELPGGKVMLAYGQNSSARRIMIFDPDWLLETSREEDFRTGLGGVSNHLYVRSLSGGWRGWAGHCAWNRMPGATLVRDPDTDDPPAGEKRSVREVLQLCRVDDPRLVSARQGVVWNFPAARKGEATVECRIVGSGFRLTLADHWMNPCDETGPELSPFSYPVTSREVPATGWRRVTVSWDCDAGAVTLSVDGKIIAAETFDEAPPSGPSYLHLQTLAETADAKGTFIRKLSMNGGSQVR